MLVTCAPRRLHFDGEPGSDQEVDFDATFASPVGEFLFHPVVRDPSPEFHSDEMLESSSECCASSIKGARPAEEVGDANIKEVKFGGGYRFALPRAAPGWEGKTEERVLKNAEPGLYGVCIHTRVTEKKQDFT